MKGLILTKIISLILGISCICYAITETENIGGWPTFIMMILGTVFVSLSMLIQIDFKEEKT